MVSISSSTRRALVFLVLGAVSCGEDQSSVGPAPAKASNVSGDETSPTLDPAGPLSAVVPAPAAPSLSASAASAVPYRVCGLGELRAPPPSYRLDKDADVRPTDHGAPLEVDEIGDVNKDGRPDVVVTTSAYRSGQGNEVQAVYLGSDGCVRYAGLVFGSIDLAPDERDVPGIDREASLRPGAFLVVTRSNLHREEQTEYRIVNGHIVGNRMRFCHTSCEDHGPARCTAWTALGDRPLPEDLWHSVPRPDEH